jgi:hypothetical protein
MSDRSCIIPLYPKERGHKVNLEEYKAHVLATREATKMSALSAIIAQSTKKEGSK